MDPAERAFARVRALAASVTDVPEIERALPALFALLDDARAEHRIAGGLAVVHHGYVRMTEDIDVVVDEASLAALGMHLATHGFTAERDDRLRHTATGVRVDLLIGGRTMPRSTAPYPTVRELGASPTDARYVDLPGLVLLKLRANRHQDRADIVALLKALDDGAYLGIDAAQPPDLRSRLAGLRRDALEELASDHG